MMPLLSGIRTATVGCCSVHCLSLSLNLIAARPVVFDYRDLCSWQLILALTCSLMLAGNRSKQHQERNRRASRPEKPSVTQCMFFRRRAGCGAEGILTEVFCCSMIECSLSFISLEYSTSSFANNIHQLRCQLAGERTSNWGKYNKTHFMVEWQQCINK